MKIFSFPKFSNSHRAPEQNAPLLPPTKPGNLQHLPDLRPQSTRPPHRKTDIHLHDRKRHHHLLDLHKRTPQTQTARWSTPPPPIDHIRQPSTPRPNVLQHFNQRPNQKQKSRSGLWGLFTHARKEFRIEWILHNRTHTALQ